MKILGLSAFYHESACCLLVDGRWVAAASEERFTRVKHDPRLPVRAFRYCLGQGGLDLCDLDAIAYYERPLDKLGRQLWAGIPDDAPRDLPWLDALQPERAIRERLGWDGPLLTYSHHASHGASAFFCSGFPEAAILTVDGVGEWATTTYGRGDGVELESFEEVEFPHSLGLLYSTLTSYLGFAVNDGEYKVMGLAPYGEPRFMDEMGTLLRSGPDGQYRLAQRYFDYRRGSRMYSDALTELLGQPPRRRGDPLTSFHHDVAASLQRALEEILLEKVRYLHERVPSQHLAMAGGVALNCVANGKIRRQGPFDEVFVQPAAGDAGGCLGAAALAAIELSGQAPERRPLRNPRLGPSWTADEVADLLQSSALPSQDFRGRREELREKVAEGLAGGKVVGLFEGAMEFGPRALGGRSILGDPRNPGMRDRINRMIKKRESFRPFAPSVLEDRAGEHFDLDGPSPFMLETCPVRSPLELPAITHVDGSARPQTVAAADHPRYAALLAAFEARTGCPLLLNTSFNLAGEPIVCSPQDALSTFVRAGLDLLVLEDFLVERESILEGLGDLFRLWEERPQSPFARRRSAIHENLYTFV